MGSKYDVWEEERSPHPRWEKIRSGFRWLGQKINQHPVRTSVIIIVSVLVIALVVVLTLGYWFNWPGVGVNGGYPKISTATDIKPLPQKITKTEEQQPVKTLWDWMQLLIIPLVLAIGGFWLNKVQKSREERTTEDNQRETALQAYLDKMSDLLLGNNIGKNSQTLAEASGEDKITKVAQARTLTVLRRLDGSRRGAVIRFLSQARPESQLITSIFDLAGADLDEANLEQLDLRGAKLRHSQLARAILVGANLEDADLRQCDLSRADLRGAKLRRANLQESCLYGARLGKVIINPREKDNKPTDLSEAKLQGARLDKTNLSEIPLENACYSKTEQPVQRDQENPVVMRTTWPQGFTDEEAERRGAVATPPEDWIN